MTKKRKSKINKAIIGRKIFDFLRPGQPVSLPFGYNSRLNPEVDRPFYFYEGRSRDSKGAIIRLLAPLADGSILSRPFEASGMTTGTLYGRFIRGSDIRYSPTHPKYKQKAKLAGAIK